MSGGYRCIVLAAFGWLTLGAAPQPSPKDQTEQAKAEAQPAQRAEPIAVTIAQPVKIVEPPVDAGPCGEGQKDSGRDLCAQWKAANAASDAAFWAMVGTMVAAIGTFGLYWQIKLTREAVEDTGDATKAMLRANQIAEAAQRPYLHIHSMGLEPVDISDSRPPFILRIKNFGQSPAVSFEAKAEWAYAVDGKCPLVWNLRKCPVSQEVPQGQIVEILVPARALAESERVAYGSRDIYCRFELAYRDSFGNQYGRFETYNLGRRAEAKLNRFRFHSSP